MSVTSGSFRWLVPPGRAVPAAGPSPRKLQAVVAIARTLLVIISPARRPSARYEDLSPDYYTTTIDTNRKARSHLPQLQAPGYTATRAPPPDRPGPSPALKSAG